MDNPPALPGLHKQQTMGKYSRLGKNTPLDLFFLKNRS
jgi:hypothetical protein